MSSVINRNNVLAGIFVVGSLALAVVIAFILGDVMEKFGSKTEYLVRFPTTVGVTGLQLLFIPTSLSRRESGIGTHLMVGADFHSGAHSAWGLKYRKTFFQAAFSTSGCIL